MAEASSSSSSIAALDLAPRQLAIGQIYVPKRPIGFVGPEAPVQYPAKWQDYIEAVIKKRGDKPIRLYADGIFDLFHYGHMRALEQAKKSFPNTYLMVGCCNDALTHKCKGQTVMTEGERYESLRHCKWVDEVVPDAPWVITDDFLAKHDIDFVCHDALPYVDTSGASSSGDVYAHLRTIHKFHETQRTEGVSTTDLIMRIIRDYDDYVRRNMARGYTPKEMGVGFVKGTTLQLEMALEKQTKQATAQLHKLGEVAESFQQDFVRLFTKEGPIKSIIDRAAALAGRKRGIDSETESEAGDGNGGSAAGAGSSSAAAGAGDAGDDESQADENGAAAAGTPSSAKRGRTSGAESQSSSARNSPALGAKASPGSRSGSPAGRASRSPGRGQHV